MEHVNIQNLIMLSQYRDQLALHTSKTTKMVEQLDKIDFVLSVWMDELLKETK